MSAQLPQNHKLQEYTHRVRTRKEEKCIPNTNFAPPKSLLPYLLSRVNSLYQHSLPSWTCVAICTSFNSAYSTNVRRNMITTYSPSLAQRLSLLPSACRSTIQ